MKLDSSLKAREVEEVIDLYFYRPLGLLITRALCKTDVHPNHVTFVSIVFGVVAGHLLYFTDLRVNLAGIVAFVIANLLDSVDGQLARLKGLQSRFGRILDGIAGGCMFTSIYLHLAVREYESGGGVLVFPLALLALYSQAVQNSVADCLLNAYLAFGLRSSGSELDMASDVRRRARESRSVVERWSLWFYASYTSTQERLTPALQTLRRALSARPADRGWEPLATAYRRLTLPLVTQRAWIATNIRMVIVFWAVLADRIVWYFWFNIVVLNLVMLALIVLHERHCRVLSRFVLDGSASQNVGTVASS